MPAVLRFATLLTWTAVGALGANADYAVHPVKVEATAELPAGVPEVHGWGGSTEERSYQFTKPAAATVAVEVRSWKTIGSVVVPFGK